MVESVVDASEVVMEEELFFDDPPREPALRRDELVREGEVLAGKYRVERVLGRGGMGIVVAAHHLQLDEKVAIKFLLPEAVSNAEVIGRFVREARAAVRIKSEHVARVSDVGTLEDGAPYMVMEYLEGSDLAGWLKEHHVLPIEQAVEFVLQACEAIAEAHALGIVHRDLKPANLFVVRRADGLWSIKVLDFGISKVVALDASGPDANLTRTTAVMGSPLYMPPEQLAASKTVDARADIWALGVILYELITGEAPFAGETLPEVCIKIAIEAPRGMRDLRADVPQALEAVVLRCLEKERARRYLNVAELALALVDFGPKRARNSVERIARTIQAAGLSASALSLPGSERSDAAPATSGVGTDAPWGRTTDALPRRTVKGWAVVLGAGVLFALSGLALGVRQGRSPSLPPDSAPAAASVSAAQRASAAPSLSPPPTASTSAVAPVTAPQISPVTRGSIEASPAFPKPSPVKPPPPLTHAPAAPLKVAAAAAAVASAAQAAPKANIFDDR